MRNKILGTIGILWGGGVVISFVARGAPMGGGAYAAGALLGLMFGVVMFIAGVLRRISLLSMRTLTDRVDTAVSAHVFHFPQLG